MKILKSLFLGIVSMNGIIADPHYDCTGNAHLRDAQMKREQEQKATAIKLLQFLSKEEVSEDILTDLLNVMENEEDLKEAVKSLNFVKDISITRGWYPSYFYVSAKDGLSYETASLAIGVCIEKGLDYSPLLASYNFFNQPLDFNQVNFIKKIMAAKGGDDTKYPWMMSDTKETILSIILWLISIVFLITMVILATTLGIQAFVWFVLTYLLFWAISEQRREKIIDFSGNIVLFVFDFLGYLFTEIAKNERYHSY